MRALLYADWCTIKSALKTYLLFLGLVAVLTVFMATSSPAPDPTGQSTQAYAGVAIMGLTMLSFLCYFAFFGSDEREGWQAHRLALPIARQSVVRARYLALLVWFIALQAVLNLLGFACGAVASLAMHGRASTPPLAVVAILSMVLLAIYLIYMAIETPIFFHLGLTRGRLFFTVPFMLVSIGFTLDPVREFADLIETRLEGLAGALGSAYPLAAGVLLVGLVAYGASMLVSERIYARRDF